MPGNQDHLGIVPVRWSDGSFLYRRTWPETVSTLTQDLLGYCPGQDRLKPVAGEAAGPEALVSARQAWEPQDPGRAWGRTADGRGSVHRCTACAAS
jgi:hypothetical protein